VGGKCVLQPYCGDGKKGADEDCDPMHPSWDAWTCSKSCKIATAYTACGNDLPDARFGCNAGEPCDSACSAGEFCSAGACVPRCNVAGDCPTAPIDAGLVPICLSGVVGGCLMTACQRASDCAPGLVCLPAESSAVNRPMCGGCSDRYACPVGKTCRLAAPSDKFKRCM
jgi:hypothetical protein